MTQTEACDRATALADSVAPLLLSERADISRQALARLIAHWCVRLPPPTLPNALDPDVEDRDRAMCRLLRDIHHEEAQLTREKWRAGLH
jgi:hypothetical protein